MYAADMSGGAPEHTIYVRLSVLASVVYVRSQPIRSSHRASTPPLSVRAHRHLAKGTQGRTCTASECDGRSHTSSGAPEHTICAAVRACIGSAHARPDRDP